MSNAPNETRVKNLSRLPVQVGIILANGNLTSIRVMPRTLKGITLPAGSKVDPRWMALNGKEIKVWSPSTDTAVKDETSSPEDNLYSTGE